MPRPTLKKLEELQILEIAGGSSGAIVGRWFAELGAHVSRIEVPADQPEHASIEENRASNPHPKIQSLQWDGQDTQWLTDRTRLCDVIIESAAPDPLRPRISADHANRAVRVHISPFDPESVFSSWRANGFINEALAGHLLLNGEPHRAPFARAGDLSTHQAALHAFIGALSALEYTEGDSGHLVQVNHHDGLLSIHQHTMTMWTHGGHILKRLGNRQSGYWHPMAVYPCRDGHIVLCAPGQSARDRLLAAIDRPELLLDPRFADDMAISQHKDEFDEEISSWLNQRTRRKIVDRLQSAGVAVSAVQTPREVLADPHLVNRKAWHEDQATACLRLPFRIEASNPTGKESLATPALKAATTLGGARVLELGRVWAGPLAGRILSDLGADVVAVETPFGRGGARVPDGLATTTHLFANNEVGDEPWNHIGSVNALLRGKRSLSVDLRQPQAMSLLRQLISATDILIENLSPGSSLAKKLTPEFLRALNPDLILVSISGHGAEGPDRTHLAFGPNIEARAGFTALGGYPNTGPMRSGVAWPDPIAALTAVAGTLVALRGRQKMKHRSIQTVDVSMLESALWVAPDPANISDCPGQGSRHTKRAPQGIYPCAGIDRWIAISITSDPEWKALCAVLDLEKRWSPLTFHQRRDRHDEIDEAIATKTRHQDRCPLAERLQAQGIMASWLSDARDLVTNQESSAKGFWIDLVEPGGAQHPTPGLPIQIDGHFPEHALHAPRLGEHNRAILAEWTQMTNLEMDRIEKAGLVSDRPPD